MLFTMDGGEGHARPMAVARVDGDTDLWLFASRDSANVREIKADASVLTANSFA